MILIAEAEDELLDTVVSRCRTVRLQRLEPAQVVQVLVGADTPRDEAEARSRWSGGSPGRASQPDALELGRAARELLADLAGGAAYADPMARVDRVGEYVDRDSPDNRLKRERLRELIRVLTWSFRDALLFGLQPDAPRLGGADAETLAALARRPGRRLEQAIEHLVRLDREVRQNVNPTLVLEGLVLDLGQALAHTPRAAAPA
jgi:hypothetical protein